MRHFLLASALVAAFIPSALGAQTAPRALVYCPPVDAVGCNRIVDVLTGAAGLPGTFAQVDRGYDGRDGTVDLRTADLNHYAVFVIPSLADGAASQPYAFLRSYRVTSRLKAHLIGRVAAWSGTPDQGEASTEKTQLLRNLASWASAPFAAVGVTGVVALQDHSEQITQRYGWLGGISRMTVTADATIGAYGEVQTLSQAGEQILDAGEGLLAYPNMATFGFHLGSSGAGVLAGAYGGTATAPETERQIVLVTYEGATGGALSASPVAGGIAINGTQWQPGDVVSVMVHEDPYLHVNRTLTATADGAGSFSATFTPASHDGTLNLTFIGLGNSSGQLAGATVADPPRVGGTEFFLQAHQDDWQLFFGDRAAASVFTAAKVVFIYTTAGDAGSTTHYWQSRERGAEGSIDAITPPGAWTCAPQAIGDRQIRRCTKANTVSYYLRLPDGNGEGQGYAGRGSLAQLRGIGTSISALDGTATYTSWNDFASTVAGVITLESAGVPEPSISIHSSDWEVGVNGGDHSDHVATGDLARQLSWGHAWNHDWYIGYQNLFQDVNVTGDAYTVKWSTIVAYDDVLRGDYGTILGQRAEDWAGRTIFRSEPSTEIALPTPPPVTGLVATPVDANRIDLTWNDTFDAEDGFRVERAGDVGGSAAGYQINATLPPNTTSWSSTELPANTRFWYRVRAIGPSGSSAYSPEVSATTPGSCSLPTFSAQPTSATGTVGGAITLSATATGGPDLVYQWRRNGTAIAGATGAQYEIGSLTIDDAGVYDVVASNACGSATSSSATLTVNKATATLQFSGLASTYTGAPQQAVVTTVPAGLTTSITYTRNGSPVASPIDAGDYAVTATVTDASYEGTASATLVIARAVPVFSNVRSSSISYGTSSITLSGTLSAGVIPPGQVAITLGVGDAARTQLATLDAAGAFSATFATATLPASLTAYPIAYRYDGDANFGAAADNSTNLTVEKAVVSVIVSSPAAVYDGTVKAANVTVDAPETLTGLAVTYTSGGAVASPVDAGTYDVVVTLDNPNYRLASAGAAMGTLVIGRRPLEVTAHGSVWQYGDANAPAPHATITCVSAGGVGGDPGASCPIVQADGISAIASTTANVRSPVGTYAVVPSLVDPRGRLFNYDATLIEGETTIQTAPLDVTPASQEKTYGQAAVAFSGTVTGIRNGDAVTATYTSAGAPAAADVGSYPITATLAGDAATLANYHVASSGTGTLTVRPAPLIVTANDHLRQYDGREFTAFTARYDGLVLGQTSAVLGGSLAFGGSAAGATAAGTYVVVPAGLTSANYDIRFVAGSLVITKAPLTVTAADAARGYGDPNPAFTGTLIGAGTDGITATYSSVADARSGVGSYAIVPLLLDPNAKLGNYEVASTNGTLTITPATLTVAAENGSKIYGQTLTAFAGSVTGVRNGDAVTGVFASAGGAAASPAGSYPITATVQGDAATLRNYIVTATPGVLTVDRAPLTVSADNVTRQYDATPFTGFTVRYDGFVNGEDASVLGGSLTFGGSAVGATDVGTYPVSPSGITSSNYAISFQDGALVINRAILAVAANSATRTYGDANPLFTGTVTGSVPSDGISATYASAAHVGSPIGSYAIVPTLVDPNARLANYAVTSINGRLTIATAPLSVTANDATKTYGQLVTAFTGSVVGARNGDAIAVTYASPGGAEASGAGTYAITPTVGGDPAILRNYAVTTADGTLTVARAPLLVTADDKAKQFDGQPFTGFTARYDGLVRDDAPSTLGGSLVFGGSAVGATAAGQYAISASGLTSPNYDISYANGTLTIGKAALTVSAANATRSYGDANPAFTGSILGLAPDARVTVTYASAAGLTSGVGTYDIVPTLSDPANELLNYTVALTPGTLTVSPAALTVSPQNATKTYGDEASNLAGSLEGIRNGDAVGASYTSTGAGAASGVGTYPITATLTGDAATLRNYSVTTRTATLTVNKAPLTVTAASATKLYGAAVPATIATYDGFVLNEGPANLDGALGFVTVATAASDVGVYSVTPSGLTATNYGITFVPGALTVNRAPLTVTADNQTKQYDGQAFTAFTASYSGFVLGQGPAALTGTLTFGGSAVGATDAGTYAITPAGVTSGNYEIAFVTGSLQIGQKTLTVTPANASRQYGTANPAFMGTVSGLAAGDAITASYSTTATQASAVGSYEITATLNDPSGALANYAVSMNTGALTVTRALLTVTAEDKARFYGEVNPAFTATYSGFVLGQDPSVLGGTLSFATPAVATSDAGTYSITPSGLTATNYAITFSAGRLLVSAAPVTVTVNDASRTYGAPNPAFTTTVTGLVEGDALACVAGTLATSASTVGQYPITASCPANSNYTFSTSPGTLTVQRATLTVRANDASREYGAANPALGGTISGFVLGEGVEALTTQPSYTTTATAASGVGSYAITASSAAAANYAFDYVNGALTVTRTPLTATAASASRTYGAANPPLTGSLTGVRNGDAISASYSTTATAASGVGTYPIIPTLLDPANALPNYAVTTSNGALSITAAPLIVTADDQRRLYGESNPQLTGTLSGLVSGDGISATYATLAVPTSPAGSYAITPALADPNGRLANYAVTSTPGTLTVDNPVPVVAATGALSPASAAKGSGDVTLQVNGSGFSPDSRIRWNAEVLSTRLVSGSAVEATVPASKFGAAATAYVTVVNAAPGGGTSEQRGFFIVDVAAAVIGSETQTSAGGTVDASFGGTTATTSGAGTIAVAQFASNPGGPVTFESTSRYFDVAVQPGSAFSEVSIQFCNLNDGSIVHWWNGASWAPVSNQSRVPETNPCITVIVNASSSPSLAALTGMVFGIGAKRTAVVSWATPAAISYGTPLGAAQLNATANTAGTFSYSPSAGTVLNVGTHTLSVTFTPSDAGTTGATQSVSLVVDKAVPTLSWSPVDVTNPTALGPAQLNAIAYGIDGTTALSGTYVYSSNGTTVTTGTVLPPGTSTPLTVVFTPTGADAINYQPATMTVTTFDVLAKIDITPGSTSNAISIGGTQKEVMVGVVSSSNFDARTLLISGVTPTLGNGSGVETVLAKKADGSPKTALTDLNFDGRWDVMLYFPKAALISNGDVTSTTTQLILQGTLSNGRQIKGTDKVTVIP